MKDLTGLRFGFLTAVRSTGRRSQAGNLIWLTICDCGEEREEDGYNLRRSSVTSCKSCGRARSTKSVRRHGLSFTPEHRAWTGIKTRCLNRACSSYANYGGRGIRVCERWMCFENFLLDMGLRPSPEHSIDRIDNSGNYEPNNCRWATRQEQSINRRTNVLLEFRGEIKTIMEWSQEKGIKYDTLLARIKRYGISGDDLFKANLRKKVVA